MIRKLSVTGGLAIGLIISVILERNLEGKHIATFVFAILLAAYWTAELVVSYIEFRKKYPEKYKYYKAKLVNEKNMELDTIENSNTLYYKKFKRSMLKESLIEFSKIVVAFGLFIAFLVGVII